MNAFESRTARWKLDYPTIDDLRVRARKRTPRPDDYAPHDKDRKFPSFDVHPDFGSDFYGGADKCGQAHMEHDSVGDCADHESGSPAGATGNPDTPCVMGPQNCETVWPRHLPDVR